MSDYTTHISLLERLSTGTDPKAWTEFHDRYGMLIRAMARRKGLQDADCDEVVQDVLTSLSKAMSGFRYDPARGKFRAYLKTITLRAIMARFSRHHPVVGTGSPVDQAIDDPTLNQAWESEWRQYHLRLAMKVIEKEFNVTDRAAFDAYAVRGEKADATARSLSISTDQVYQAKSRILRRLEVLIERQVQEEG